MTEVAHCCMLTTVVPVCFIVWAGVSCGHLSSHSCSCVVVVSLVERCAFAEPCVGWVFDFYNIFRPTVVVVVEGPIEECARSIS